MSFIFWTANANKSNISENQRDNFKVGDHSRGWPEGSRFDSLLHQCVGEGANPFPGLLHFTLDQYLIMLSVKQGGIKYHFLSLWYDSTWDRNQVSRAIGEHSNRQANVRYKKIGFLEMPGIEPRASRTQSEIILLYLHYYIIETDSNLWIATN